MTTSSPEFRIRAFEDRDLPPVLDVLKASLGETPVLQRTEKLFRWKHIDNPFGRSILLLATHGDRIASLRAFMRWDLTTPDGTRLRGVRPVDTATHPDYQRMGLFRRLTQEAIDIARDDGVDLIFNTPNPQSGAGYVKMGWTIVGRLGVLARPAVRVGSDFTTPDHDYTRWLPRRPARGLATEESDAYRQWRFLGHPTAEYTAFGDDRGACVIRWNVRSGRRERIISALYGEPAPSLRKALRVPGCRYTVAWFPPGSPERTKLLRRGIVPIPGLHSLTLAALPLRKLPFDPTVLSNWDLGLSDLELL
jgi:GNAT superfamily N-acetyltransferase